MTWLVLTLLGCKPAPPEPCSSLSQLNLYDDADGDGFGDPATERTGCELVAGSTIIGGDCDDTSPITFPEAAEQCDGQDNDCDNTIDEEMPLKTWYSDYDGDGIGNENYPVESCAQPERTALESGDCNDADANVSPFGREVCNGIDDDCDGKTDDADPSVDPNSWSTFYSDDDDDGAGDPLAPIEACAAPQNAVDNADDCDDQDDLVGPNATEICNGEDDDCDGQWEESDADIDPDSLPTWWYDGDGDGAGDADVTLRACAAPLFYVGNDDDCDDAEPLLAGPAPWVEDLDGDGYGAGFGSPPSCNPPAPGWALAARGFDCADTAPDIYPGGTEICDDGVDQDCSGFDTFCSVGISETCFEAGIQPTATTGTWYVAADPAIDNIDVGAGVCTTAASNGREGFVQIDVNPSEFVTLTHVGDADASAYLLTNCGLASTCVGGADNDAADAAPETLRWENTSGTVSTVYAVFDCADGTCTTIDGVITVNEEPLLADTCGEAETWTPLATGTLSLSGTVSGFTGDLSLAAGGCTGATTPGPEGFLPVVIAAGQTLEASHEQSTQNASVYLLTDCSLASSCLAGRDLGGGGVSERLIWVNLTGSDVTAYVGFDCASNGCTDFNGTLQIY